MSTTPTYPPVPRQARIPANLLTSEELLRAIYDAVDYNKECAAEIERLKAEVKYNNALAVLSYTAVFLLVMTCICFRVFWVRTRGRATPAQAEAPARAKASTQRATPTTSAAPATSTTPTPPPTRAAPTPEDAPEDTLESDALLLDVGEKA